MDGSSLIIFQDSGIRKKTELSLVEQIQICYSITKLLKEIK